MQILNSDLFVVVGLHLIDELLDCLQIKAVGEKSRLGGLPIVRIVELSCSRVLLKISRAEDPLTKDS